MSLIDKLKSGIQDRFRPVLSDRTIMEYNKKGLLIEQKIDDRIQLQPNSVDLTLGNTWKKLKSNSSQDGHSCIDPALKIDYNEGLFTTQCKETSFRKLGSSQAFYILEPNEFVLMASKEVLNIPNGILCFVQGRSSIARMAVQTEQAGLIDAGFKGTITFEVKNESDHSIVLYEGMRIAQVYFFKAQYALHPYGSRGKGSKYQTQVEATGSKVYMDPELYNLDR